jgi:hypothetical protein
VRVAVSYRSVRLEPPTPEDLAWVAQAIDVGGLWIRFGWPQPLGNYVVEARGRGEAIIAVVRAVRGGQRLGFGLVFAPPAVSEPWEALFAIPEAAARNAFAALQSFDALLYYLFEQVSLDLVGWRVRADNLPALAVLSRMGFEPESQLALQPGPPYWMFRMGPEAWAERRRRLESGTRQFTVG